MSDRNQQDDRNSNLLEYAAPGTKERKTAKLPLGGIQIIYIIIIASILAAVAHGIHDAFFFDEF